MQVNQYIKREDGKLFKVLHASHWSIVQSDDGEQDTIKFLGNNNTNEVYIGAADGRAFVLPLQGTVRNSL